MERIPEALLRVTASIRGKVVASSASRERCLSEASTVIGEGALSCEEVSIRGTKESESVGGTYRSSHIQSDPSGRGTEG